MNVNNVSPSDSFINQVITLYNTVRTEAHIFYAAVRSKHVREFLAIYFLLSITLIDVSILTQVSKFLSQKKNNNSFAIGYFTQPQHKREGKIISIEKC